MKEFKFYGRGGQGIVTASKMMVAAVVKEERYAQAVPSFGQERKGAPVFTFARVSNNPIDLKSFVYKPNGIVVFDLFVRELGINIKEGLKSDAVLVANTPLSPEETELTEDFIKIGCLDAFDITEKLIGTVPPNAVMLGAMCRTMELFELATICNVIREFMPGKRGELNVEACKCGYNSVQVWER